ncbi:MAG: hypothetical protein GOV15_00170 [Candidatus Diapherotrites archaeon]|nr:hypothetical protein [Candidatus Diapherotrites archaeon]
MVDAKEAYLRGRLEGLYQLAEILKTLVDNEAKKGDPMVRTLALHVFEELGEILEGMRKGKILGDNDYESAASTVSAAKADVKAGSSVDTHVGAGKDLMKELMAASKKK